MLSNIVTLFKNKYLRKKQLLYFEITPTGLFSLYKEYDTYKEFFINFTASEYYSHKLGNVAKLQDHILDTLKKYHIKKPIICIIFAPFIRDLPDNEKNFGILQLTLCFKSTLLNIKKISTQSIINKKYVTIKNIILNSANELEILKPYHFNYAQFGIILILISLSIASIFIGKTLFNQKKTLLIQQNKELISIQKNNATQPKKTHNQNMLIQTIKTNMLTNIPASKILSFIDTHIPSNILISSIECLNTKNNNSNTLLEKKSNTQPTPKLILQGYATTINTILDFTKKLNASKLIHQAYLVNINKLTTSTNNYCFYFSLEGFFSNS